MILEKTSFITSYKSTTPKNRERGGGYLSLKQNPLKASFELNIQGMIFTIPTELADLRAEIMRSAYILGLADNWDDEGSVGYDKATWEKGVVFVIDYAKWALKTFGKVIYLPSIYHGKQGGIDIIWENNRFRMLIRIDKTAKTGVFYADTPQKQTSEGEFDLNNLNYYMLPIPIDF